MREGQEGLVVGLGALVSVQLDVALTEAVQRPAADAAIADPGGEGDVGLRDLLTLQLFHRAFSDPEQGLWLDTGS